MEAKLHAINPYSGQLKKTYNEHTLDEINQIIASVNRGQEAWKNVSLSKRIEHILAIAEELRSKKNEFARLMSDEMGKRLNEGVAEIEKCAWLCDHYASEATRVFTSKTIETDAQESFVQYEPLGVILGVMPWNFPFWQVFRFAVPTLLAGNTCLLKHASNVPGCALAIESIINRAIGQGEIFKTLLIASSKVEHVISNWAVRGVSLTGSEKAGIAVAETAGKFLKPSLLELGGNNAFIVLKDANLEKAAEDFIIGRFQNCGQSCIAAKRLMIAEEIYDEAISMITSKIKDLAVGDPLTESAQLGPMARADLAQELKKQVQESIEKGARLALPLNVNEAVFQPTLLTDVKPGMPAFDEELFGPVAAAMKIKNLEEAIALSNQSKFGLGVAIYTRNTTSLKPHLSQFNEGGVFVNSIVKSDPRLPFGGVKNSGYGRELSDEGLMAFVNIKTIYIND